MTVAAVVVLAFAVRLAYGMRVPLDADEATSAIVAVRITHGRFALMEASLHYLGALNSYVMAPFMIVFGSGLLAVRAATATVGAAYVLVMYFLGRRLFSSHRGGVALCVVASFFPAFALTWDMKARSYGESLLITAICALLAVRIGWPGGTRPRPRDRFLLGLAAGIGVWGDILLVAPLAVIAVAMLARSAPLGPRALLHGALHGTTGFITGFAPWIVYNVIHPLRSLHGLPSGHVPVATAIRGFLTIELPIFAGGWATADRRLVDHRVADGMVALLLIAVVWIRRAPMVAVLTDVARRRFLRIEPVEMVLAILPVMVAVAMLGRSNNGFAEPRYLIPAALPMAVAAALVLLQPWPLRGPAVLGAGATAIVGLLIAGGPTVDSERFTSGGGRIPDDLSPLIAALPRHDPRPIIADYWLARPLMYESGGAITPAVYGGGVGFPEVQDPADNSRDPRWLLLADDTTAGTLTSFCAAHRISFRVTRIGRSLARLYSDFSVPVHPTDLHLAVVR